MFGNGMSNQGGFLPNTFQTPNDYVDLYMPYLTDTELRVIMYMTRRIIGFHRKERYRRISVDQMVNGLVIDGKRADRGIGANKAAVIGACKSLEEHGLIIKVDNGNKKFSLAALYDLPLENPETINIDALIARHSAKISKRKRQTRRATNAKTKPSPMSKSTSNVPNPKSTSNDTLGGTSNDTLGGTSNDTLGGTSNDTFTSIEIQYRKPVQKTSTETQKTNQPTNLLLDPIPDAETANNGWLVGSSPPEEISLNGSEANHSQNQPVEERATEPDPPRANEEYPRAAGGALESEADPAMLALLDDEQVRIGNPDARADLIRAAGNLDGLLHLVGYTFDQNLFGKVGDFGSFLVGLARNAYEPPRELSPAFVKSDIFARHAPEDIRAAASAQQGDGYRVPEEFADVVIG